MTTGPRIWGTLGPVIFEFLKSPVYGSVSYRKGARYTKHSRIIARDAFGNLSGQKPLKEIAGLDLTTATFDCKVSALLLKQLKVSTGASIALALGAGPFVGSALGELADDERFYTDVEKFLKELDDAMAEQTPLAWSIGSRVMGMYTVDSMDVTERNRADGALLHAEIRVGIEEWEDPNG